MQRELSEIPFERLSLRICNGKPCKNCNDNCVSMTQRQSNGRRRGRHHPGAGGPRDRASLLDFSVGPGAARGLSGPSLVNSGVTSCSPNENEYRGKGSVIYKYGEYYEPSRYPPPVVRNQLYAFPLSLPFPMYLPISTFLSLPTFLFKKLAMVAVLFQPVDRYTKFKL